MPAKRPPPAPAHRPRTESKFPAMVPAIAAARAMTGSVNGAARMVGVPRSTVLEILKRNPEAVSEAQKALATKLLGVSDRAADAITDQKLRRCSAPQAAVVMGVAAQRAVELLHGPAPGIVVNLGLLQGGQERVRSLADELAAIKQTIDLPEPETLPVVVSPAQDVISNTPSSTSSTPA